MLATATCLSHVRLIQDAVSPTVTLFVQELLGDALPTKFLSLFFFFFGFLFSACHSLDHRRQERVYGNMTAVGALQVWSEWGDLLGAIVNWVLVESLVNASRNNYTVELRDGRLGLVKEFVVVDQGASGQK